MDESVDFDHIRYSYIPCFATCLEVPALKTKYFNISGLEESKVKSILIASSALPVIYGQEKIDGKTYIDGGVPNFGDNVPIKPLYDIGIRNFLVVHLSRDSIIEKDFYPDARILQIVPKENQGDLMEGTLDFSSEGARRRIEQGYNDTLRVLEPLYEMGIVQKRILDKSTQLQVDESNFYETRANILSQRSIIKNELENLADAWRRKIEK